MSGRETPGLVLDLTPTPAPAPVAASVGGARGIVQAAGGWWGLIRFLPGALRQVFSGREPVGGLPVVEPGQTPAPRVPEIDFGESFPTADHGLAAETALTASRPNRCATSNAWLGPHFAGDAEQQRYEAWLAQAGAVVGAGVKTPDVTDAQAGSVYDEWLAMQEPWEGGEARLDAAEVESHLAEAGEAVGTGPGGQASAAGAVQASQAGVEAVAELGEAGMGEAGL